MTDWDRLGLAEHRDENSSLEALKKTSGLTGFVMVEIEPSTDLMDYRHFKRTFHEMVR